MCRRLVNRADGNLCTINFNHRDRALKVDGKSMRNRCSIMRFYDQGIYGIFRFFACTQRIFVAPWRDSGSLKKNTEHLCGVLEKKRSLTNFAIDFDHTAPLRLSRGHAQWAKPAIGKPDVREVVCACRKSVLAKSYPFVLDLCPVPAAALALVIASMQISYIRNYFSPQSFPRAKRTKKKVLNCSTGYQCYAPCLFLSLLSNVL